MNLASKKELASKVLGVGKKRILFVEENLAEIKEAITRQDVKDLHESGAIQVREVSGRKKIVRRKNRRRVGKIKCRVNNRKSEYVIITRKLRAFTRGLVRTGAVTKDQNQEIRKQIRARKFRSKRQLKEHVENKL